MSLIIDHVNKSFKYGFLSSRKLQILKDVSFNAESGAVLALIGQNGAGKTTLIKCILDFLHLDSGKIVMDGFSISQIIRQGKLGYMPETLKFPDMITFKEYITDLMVLRGKNITYYQEYFESLIEKFYMNRYTNKLLSQYSKGTMKKAAFIQAVLHKPDILILDEPTDGLDPVSRRTLLNEVLKIKKSGGTVIITTHLLSDLALVADKVIVLQDGKIINQTNMNDIHDTLDDWYIETIKTHGGLDRL